MTVENNLFRLRGLLSLTVVTVGVSWALGLTGCASRGGKAPIEDRPVTGTPSSAARPGAAASTKPVNRADTTVRPASYTVKPGDTLSLIAKEWGVTWQDIARWNNLDNPNQIEVGQALRLAPPPAGTAASGSEPSSTASASTTPASSGGSRPVASVVAAGADSPPPAAAPAKAPASAASSAPAPLVATEDAIGLIWPANGAVISGFDAQKNKGISIAGNAGDPVWAAADGVVVYAGAGLRGYGNLVIVKHNAVFLTAYAHNQTLLVKDDQQVRKGQKIAEMGSSESDRVKLHFEVRRNSTPVDPTKYLPSR